MTIAATLVLLVAIYAAAGAVVALVFLLFGIDRVEPNARHAYLFRPLLIPGILLLWPLVSWRWRQLATGRLQPGDRHMPPRGLQSACALVLAIVIPLIVLSALILRQDGPRDAPAIKLEDPA